MFINRENCAIDFFLPLFAERGEGRGEECPSLRLSPRSFLAGREWKISPQIFEIFEKVLQPMNYQKNFLFASMFFSVICSAAVADELFNGKDVTGWRKPTGAWTAAKDVKMDSADPGKFIVTPGEGILINGANGKSVNLVSAPEFSDVELHVEFWIPKHSNSGVYLMGRYEIQIYDVEKPKYPGQECGGIYGRAAGEETVEGHSPLVNASKPPGEWQTFDITFRAPRFDADGKRIAKAKFVKVLHNGQVVHENVELNGPTRSGIATNEKPTGPIMLQGNHGPVAFRNLRIQAIEPTEISAAKTTALPPKIVSRAEWKARPPTGPMKPHQQRFITIHHTATKQKMGVPVGEKLQHLQQFSQHEGKLAGGKIKPPWPDVPYHFYIGCDGDIGEGRDVNFVGDTNTEYNPAGHVLVTLEGNFQEENPTEAQIKATRELVAWLAQKYKIPAEKIRAHKDYAQTACPGKNLYRRIDELRPAH